MKHIFYFTLLVIFSSVNILNAQVPVTLTYDGNDITGSEITLERDVSMDIHVSNIGISDMNIVVEITDINFTHKAPVMEVCWGECFLPTDPVILGTVNVPAGTTNTSDFHVTYHSYGNTDPADISFHVYEDGTPGDYVTLVLDTEHVGVNNLNKNDFFSIYPNPATTFFNIKVSEELADTKIVITNIIGKVIKTIDVQRSDYRFSADKLLTGIYFVSIIKDKEVLTTKKLIVN